MLRKDSTRVPVQYVTSLDGMEHSPSYRAFRESPYPCHKHTTFFDVYDQLFSRYRGKRIVFVEIGVLGGGSLFMWRNFFGPEARIIGIDLNPGAVKLREHGFEIFIGNQADESFWKRFIGTVGDIDIVLDDGGHTYVQQIITCECLLPHIRDGGLLVVEDTHTSYMPGFGLRKYSFIEYTKVLIDRINNRFEFFAGRRSEWRTWSLCFFESFVVFEVNKAATNIPSFNIHNMEKDGDAIDFRHSDNAARSFLQRCKKRFSFLKVIPGAAAVLRLALHIPLAIRDLTVDSRIKRYFSK